jgi:transposase
LVDNLPLWDTRSRKEESIVPKTRPAYAPEYRRRIVELARSGRSPEELAKEFEPSAQTIRTWINQDRTDAGERPGLTSGEKEELVALRRRVKALEEEKEILRKATVFFVRETSR